MNQRVQLPAEWTAQSAVMLTWPHRHGDWQPWLERVEPVFTEIGYHVAQREKLLISCWDDEHAAHIRRLLLARGAMEDNLRLFVVPSNDTWARDHGPIAVLSNGEPLLLDFGFNGWGKKYEANYDNQITHTLHKLGAFGSTSIEAVDMVLEGGSIDVDGKGTLLTTKHCLLAPTRNPHLSQQDIENRLRRLLGVDRILWLEHGHLAGDDTDSHIDTLARFCDENTICYVSCADERDEHYVTLRKMEQELQSFHTRDGKPYRLVPLPWPQAKYNEDGARLPATYANFLIINGAVLLPTYGDDNDMLACAQLAECFPSHEIVAIDCAPLIMQYGSLHCVTMQIPAGIVK